MLPPMMRPRIAGLLALLLPLHACIESVVEIPAGQPGGVCRAGEMPCDSGASCSAAGQCFAVDDPCSGYGCGEGSCRVVDDAPFCECPAGSIHAEGSEPCRAVRLPVDPRPGTAGGLCLAPDGRCEEAGVECNRDQNYCYVPDDPCVGFACGGLDRGRCEPQDGLPTCLCFEGYDNEQYALYCCPSAGGDPSCT